MLEGDARFDAITARHILAHTSGLPNTRSTEDPLKIHSAPGEKWRYSGEGYFYLQSVITALTGGRVDRGACERFERDMVVCATNFDTYMRRNVLAPLGMKDSGYLLTGLSRNLARPHDDKGGALPYRRPTAAAVARYGAMGALLTTANDYARFLIEVMAPKAQDRHRLGARMLNEMLRPQIHVADGDGYSIWWSMGWRVMRSGSTVVVGHGGDQTGFHTHSEFCREARSGYVILTNGENGARLIGEVAPGISKWIHGRA